MMAKNNNNTNTYDTHKETADNAEAIVKGGGKK